MFILGFVDDVIRLKPQSKLLGQILVASLIAFLGFRLQWVTSLTLDTLLTIFWIVGITNAFNLLDNMDGLCAGTGMIAAAFLAVILSGISLEYAQCAAILASASAAFLFYNFNPASIFMGDCGSLMIGFGISLLSLGLFGNELRQFHGSHCSSGDDCHGSHTRYHDGDAGAGSEREKGFNRRQGSYIPSPGADGVQ